MRYGVSWVCKRLAMAVPEGADQQIQAISEQVYQARGRELKEASPVPPKLVMALEIMVETCAKVRKPALALLSRWALILIYASLRFDDGVHVAPLSLQITEDALYGVVWQTKVERKRRGTRFAAPRCSLSGIDWLKIGWELFAPFRTDRDFFIWDLKTDVEFTEAPVTYTRGLAWLKHTLMKGVSQLVVAGKAGVNEAAELEAAVRPVTWHSMRVTFLSEAVKASVDDKVVGLQANWKDPKQLVLKYARQRKELSVAMVKKVAAQLRDRWTPDPAEFLVEEEDAEVGDVHPVEYIVRKSLPKTAPSASRVSWPIAPSAALKWTKVLFHRFIGAMVDRTQYTDEAHTPKIALRQIFGRLALRSELCKSAADAGLLTVEVFAMLGDAAGAVKDTLKGLIPTNQLGDTDAARELAVMQLAAVWHACHALQGQFALRRARMEEDPNKVPEMAQEDHSEFRARFVQAHPDVILLDAREPHKKFVEKLSRDFLVQGMVPFYPVAEIRTRADSIAQKAGLSKNAEDLLSITKADEPDQVTDVSTLLNRVHALFMGLEYLNIWAYSRAAGPLKYLQELEQLPFWLKVPFDPDLDREVFCGPGKPWLRGGKVEEEDTAVAVGRSSGGPVSATATTLLMTPTRSSCRGSSRRSRILAR